MKCLREKNSSPLSTYILSHLRESISCSCAPQTRYITKKNCPWRDEEDREGMMRGKWKLIPAKSEE